MDNQRVWLRSKGLWPSPHLIVLMPDVFTHAAVLPDTILLGQSPDSSHCDTAALQSTLTCGGVFFPPLSFFLFKFTLQGQQRSCAGVIYDM